MILPLGRFRSLLEGTRREDQLPHPPILFDRKKTEIKVEGCNFLLQLLGLLARDETDKEDMRDSNLGTSSMLLYHATVIIQGK